MPASEGVSSLCIIMFTTQSAIGGIAPPKKIDKYSIIFYHILSYSIIFYHILSYSIIFYHILSYSIIFYHILSYSIIFYHILSYSIIFYHILSYSIIFYHILSYSIPLSIGFDPNLRYLFGAYNGLPKMPPHEATASYHPV